MIGDEIITLSVCMITYNHEKFIKEAIEGVLMQKTSFPFELIIGDDYSNDRTREICLRYKKKYPHIIKLIYSDKNNGMMQNFINTLFASRGRYIAICEGDDYWTNSNKLQVQYNFMEKNKSCTLCFHAYNEIDALTGNISLIKRNDIQSRYFNMEELIIKGGSFVGTQTMLIRKEIINTLPFFFLNAPSADYPLVLLAKHFGDAYYINEVMANYRKNNQFSAMGVVNQLNFADKMTRFAKTSSMLHNFNEYTNYKYNHIIKRFASKILFKVFRRHRLETTLIERIKILIKLKPLFRTFDLVLSCVLLFPIPATRKQWLSIFS